MRFKDLENLENVSIDIEAENPTTGEKLKDAFCDDWGKARPAVENLLMFIKNPIVKFIITLVLSIGDGVKAKICPVIKGGE